MRRVCSLGFSCGLPLACSRFYFSDFRSVFPQLVAVVFVFFYVSEVYLRSLPHHWFGEPPCLSSERPCTLTSNISVARLCLGVPSFLWFCRKTERETHIFVFTPFLFVFEFGRGGPLKTENHGQINESQDGDSGHSSFSARCPSLGLKSRPLCVSCLGCHPVSLVLKGSPFCRPSHFETYPHGYEILWRETLQHGWWTFHHNHVPQLPNMHHNCLVGTHVFEGSPYRCVQLELPFVTVRPHYFPHLLKPAGHLLN